VANPFVGGLRVRDVSVFGQVIDAFVDVDRVEHARRERVGVGGLADPEVVQALMSLPGLRLIPVADISPIDLAVLADLPPGVVRISGSWVERLAVPPVAIRAIARNVETWTDVAPLAFLRTHAPRLLIFEEESLLRRAVRETDRDVGIARVLAEDVVEVVRPPGRRWLRPSWQRWISEEATYERWRNAR